MVLEAISRGCCRMAPYVNRVAGSKAIRFSRRYFPGRAVPYSIDGAVAQFSRATFFATTNACAERSGRERVPHRGSPHAIFRVGHIELVATLTKNARRLSMVAAVAYAGLVFALLFTVIHLLR